MQFPAFLGLSPVVASELVRLADAAQLDPIAIAAFVEHESGWNPEAGTHAWSWTAEKKHTASGLLQLIESEAKKLFAYMGRALPPVEFVTRDYLLKLSALDQLPFVIAYFQQYLRSRRIVDYYLAGLGRGQGAPSDYVLIDGFSNAPYQPGLTHAQVYDQNKSLDVDRDGKITVSDLEQIMATTIANARRRGSIELDEKKKPVVGDCS